MKKSLKIIIAVALLMLYLFSLIGMASAIVIKSVSTNPVKIAPGETSTIEIILENDLEIDVKDISVALDFKDVPFAPFESSSENSINEIREDDEERVRFKVIALNDAKSGIYKIPILISYIEEEIVKTKNSLMSLSVNAEPILGLENKNDLLLKNTRNNVEITVINKGLGDVRFLEIELGNSAYVEILSSKNVYIGDINSDDFDSGNFNIFFDENSPDIINLSVILKYRDASNNEVTENFNMVLEVYSREKAIELGLITESKTTTYIGIIIGLIVIFFIYRAIRKKMNSKKNYEF